MKREVAKDPWEPRLKPITNDAKVQGGLPAWILKSYNVKNNTSLGINGKKPKNYGVVSVKSMWWPGAYNFYNNEKLSFIYVGSGHKHEARKFYPVKIPVMVDEKEEMPCQDEPNPT
jgi:hypothetical protein